MLTSTADASKKATMFHGCELSCSEDPGGLEMFWLVVGTSILFSQKYWEFHHPNWRTRIFQRGGPTTNQCLSHDGCSVASFKHQLVQDSSQPPTKNPVGMEPIFFCEISSHGGNPGSQGSPSSPSSLGFIWKIQSKKMDDTRIITIGVAPFEETPIWNLRIMGQRSFNTSYLLWKAGDCRVQGPGFPRLYWWDDAALNFGLLNDHEFFTWWFIPLREWVITLIISGLTPLIPFITRVITHLLSGMNHQVVWINERNPSLPANHH